MNGVNKAFITLILISILCIAQADQGKQGDGKAHLEKGLKAYQKDADFDTAILELQKAVEMGLSDRTDLIKAHLHLGFAYIAKGQRINAMVEFAKVINLDPSLTLDPKLYSSKIINIFNETKEGLVDLLTVISVPGGADVYLDGQKMGTTPIKMNSVLVGEHLLTVTKEFFQPKTLNIRVEKGEDNRLEVYLDKSEIGLQITSQPLESAVYISENLVGKTPLTLKIFLDQELQVKLAKEGFLDKELKLRLTPAGVSIYGTEEIVPVKDGIGNVYIELEPAPIPGSLRVISDPPDADVYLDGIASGKTPLTIVRVTPGTREIRVAIPNFDSVAKKVEITSGKETVVEVALGGRLHISSVPSSAQVFIDGKYFGVTPLRTERLSTGSHQIKLVKEKYKDRVSTVIIERGQEKELNLRLLPIRGSIVVSSEPAGAECYIDGELKGITPIFIYGALVGQYSLKLVKEGYRDWESIIIVKENEISWCFGRLGQM